MGTMQSDSVIDSFALSEDRLLYVGMTRAIEILVMTCDRASEFVERIGVSLEKVR